MAEYHNTAKGPRPCRVDKSNPNSRGCPLGGTHFDSFDDAMEAYTENLKETFGEFHVVIRPSLAEKSRRVGYRSLDRIEKVKANPHVKATVNNFRIVQAKAKEALEEIKSSRIDSTQSGNSTSNESTDRPSSIPEDIETRPLSTLTPEVEEAESASAEVFSSRGESMAEFSSRVVNDFNRNPYPFKTKPLDREDVDRAIRAIRAKREQAPEKSKVTVRSRVNARLKGYTSKVSAKVRTAKDLAKNAVKDKVDKSKKRISDAGYAARASAAVAKDTLTLKARSTASRAKDQAVNAKQKIATVKDAATVRASRMNIPAGHIRPGDTFDGTTVRSVESASEGKVKISYQAKPGGPMLSTVVDGSRSMSVDRKTRREARNARFATKTAKSIAQTKELSGKIHNASSKQIESFKNFRKSEPRFESIQRSILQEKRIARQRELVTKLRDLRSRDNAASAVDRDLQSTSK